MPRVLPSPVNSAPMRAVATNTKHRPMNGNQSNRPRLRALPIRMGRPATRPWWHEDVLDDELLGSAWQWDGEEPRHSPNL